jgi:hypothetical protein
MTSFLRCHDVGHKIVNHFFHNYQFFSRAELNDLQSLDPDLSQIWLFENQSLLVVGGFPSTFLELVLIILIIIISLVEGLFHLWDPNPTRKHFLLVVWHLKTADSRSIYLCLLCHSSNFDLEAEKSKFLLRQIRVHLNQIILEFVPYIFCVSPGQSPPSIAESKGAEFNFNFQILCLDLWS